MVYYKMCVKTLGGTPVLFFFFPEQDLDKRVKHWFLQFELIAYLLAKYKLERNHN